MSIKHWGRAIFKNSPSPMFFSVLLSLFVNLRYGKLINTESK